MRSKLAIALAAAVFAAPVASDEVAGRASVIDGDTIEVRGKRIRLYGMDAPETRQTCLDADGRLYRCGQRAALALADLIGSQPIRCEEQDVDRWGRVVATCFLSDGTDIGGAMVSAGHALAFRRYSRAYLYLERQAEAAGRGMWSGMFEPPWEWRKVN